MYGTCLYSNENNPEIKKNPKILLRNCYFYLTKCIPAYIKSSTIEYA